MERRPEKTGAASAASHAHAAAGKSPAHATSQKAIEIFTDGACSGNPGPGGWAAILRSGAHERELFGGETQTTNNRMELTAVIESLRTIKKPSHVRVHTDSKYVMDGARTWMTSWKARGWKTADKKPVKNVDLWRALDEQLQRHLSVAWTWVAGHSGHPENERADFLARSAIQDLKASRS